MIRSLSDIRIDLLRLISLRNTERPSQDGFWHTQNLEIWQFVIWISPSSTKIFPYFSSLSRWRSVIIFQDCPPPRLRLHHAFLLIFLPHPLCVPLLRPLHDCSLRLCLLSQLQWRLHQLRAGRPVLPCRLIPPRVCLIRPFSGALFRPLLCVPM